MGTRAHVEGLASGRHRDGSLAEIAQKAGLVGGIQRLFDLMAGR